MNWRLWWKQLREFDVADLDLKEAGRWPVVLQGLCCVLVLIAAFYITQWYLAAPREQALEQGVAKEQELLSQFGLKSFQVANLALLREQMATLDKRMAALVSMLPTDAEVPALLDDISETARANRLGIDFIRLAPPVAHDFYVEQPFNIQVVGDYHHIAAFVSGVANLPRIVTLHDFTLAPKPADAKHPGSDQAGEELTLAMVAKTYRYEAASGDADGKAKVKATGARK